jgi:PAS domain S-box-containing protein
MQDGNNSRFKPRQAIGESTSQLPPSGTEFFHDVFRASPIGIAIENFDGQLLFVNPAFCSFLGFTEEELRCKHCVDFSPPEDAKKDWALFQQLREGAIDHYQLEKRYFRRDGSLVWGRLSLSLLNRLPPLVIALVEDITDKKKAEDALRVSEERLRLAQRAARIGTFELNIQTGVNEWTPELNALYGLVPGGFAGTQPAFLNLVHPEDRPAVIALVDDAMKSGQPASGEWRVVWPDGSIHWIAGRWQVFMNESGEPSRMIGVNSDVTERKLTENKLREYERAVEGVEDIIVVVDREYRCLMANQGFLKRRNLTAEQVVGHFVDEFMKKDVYEDVVKPKLDECFQGKVVRYELKYTYPQLGERDLSASYYPVEGSNGVDRAACILHDITDRKRAERALAEMTRKLIEAQEQERARIGRELHDDINQRLAMLSVELETLQCRPSELQSRVHELRKELRQISDDVQAISHDLHSSKLEYLGAVAGMESWCKEVAKRYSVELDFRSDVCGALPLEIGLPLFRVLQEAVNNAMKHARVRRVEVQVQEDSHAVHLVVKDQGVGFNMETALRGKGLGLTSMRERVWLVNGAIDIDSKPMGGTQIHVRVPREQPPHDGQLVS